MRLGRSVQDNEMWEIQQIAWGRMDYTGREVWTEQIHRCSQKQGWSGSDDLKLDTSEDARYKQWIDTGHSHWTSSVGHGGVWTITKGDFNFENGYFTLEVAIYITFSKPHLWHLQGQSLNPPTVAALGEASRWESSQLKPCPWLGMSPTPCLKFTDPKKKRNMINTS